MARRQPEMDRAYWDDTADDYDAQIHDSLKQDRRGIIPKRIREFGSRAIDGKVPTIAADFGCGVGKYLPLLARRFEHVHAIDLSPALIERAIGHCAPHDNITYHVVDLAEPDLSLPRCGFAVCTNVLIVPDRDVRRRVLANIRAALRPGGHLLAVVPSMENALFVNQVLVEWNRRGGLEVDDAYAESLESLGRDVRAVIDGVIRIDGVPTKHYLHAEAEVMFADAGFSIRRVDRVEYDWTTEFARPPKWLGDPLPWDWLFVVERR